jgi:hypothetical protein
MPTPLLKDSARPSKRLDLSKFDKNVNPTSPARIAAEHAVSRRNSEGLLQSTALPRSPKRSPTAGTVAGLFFPQREALGLEQREYSPGVIAQLVLLGGEVRSFARASAVFVRISGNKASAKTIERLTEQIGTELVDHRDSGQDSAFHRTIEEPPETVTVQCDGGRIMTRAADAGPGVHDQAWKETKCATFHRMTHHSFEEDPQPDLPPAFRDRKKVTELAETGYFESTSDGEEESGSSKDTTANESTKSEEKPPRPRPLHRTCLASMVCSVVFGAQMEREAIRRRFFEAINRAFLGDGLPWNWSIHAKHFKDFIPILDFIHAVSYLYSAAVVMKPDDPEASWELYLELAQLSWSGQADEVLNVLEKHLQSAGIDPESKCAKGTELYDVHVAYRYLSNNRTRMDYPRYRMQGLPVTSSLMESMVKQINQRAKGTEMFWCRGQGAESILQVRAAVLCDDDRLQDYLAKRPGRATVRPPKTEPQLAA